MLGRVFTMTSRSGGLFTWAVVAAIALAGIVPTTAMVTEGWLPVSSDFREFVGKFCFDFSPGKELSAGTFRVDFGGRVRENALPGSTPRDSMEGRLWLMVFDDEIDRWPAVGENLDSITCQEARAHANHAAAFSLPLQKQPFEWSQTVAVSEGLRPRFWYFAVFNCGAEVLSPVSFKLHTQNSLEGVEAEFGMDMQGSLAVESLFFCLFLGVVSTAFYATSTRTARLVAGQGRLPPLLGFVKASCACSTIGCLLKAFHYHVYRADGQGLVFVELVGTVFACAAKGILTVLQFFIAKGWALVTQEGQYSTRCSIMVLLLCSNALTIGAEVHERYFRDESTQFYMYEDWTGNLILCVNLTLLLGAWVSTSQAIGNETMREVRVFYIMSAAGCTVYFGTLPVIHVVASYLDPWVVRKYIQRAELVSRLLASLVLLRCLWPSSLDNIIAARLKNGPDPQLLSDREEGVVELTPGLTGGIQEEDEDE
eukprot:TRINITY_DN15422_c0_g1_i1.p1 TRINITY_DN15422_c0_g1~~TRINITY_DN15422_c0_g1_i1.p1  ORF type:complete len:482 (-),score=82.32 TRINITY_DN15422_c0_g1_i1:184-1629(-)